MYEKVIGLGLKDAAVYNNLGYMLVENGIDIERGIDLIEKAVEKQSKNPRLLDSLGSAYYKVGRAREGYDLIKRSLEIDDSGPSGEKRRSHLEEIHRALESSEPRR